MVLSLETMIKPFKWKLLCICLRNFKRYVVLAIENVEIKQRHKTKCFFIAGMPIQWHFCFAIIAERDQLFSPLTKFLRAPWFKIRPRLSKDIAHPIRYSLPDLTDENNHTNIQQTNIGTHSVRELFCSCHWEVRKWLLNERACAKVHYCDVIYLSSVEHSKKYWFLDRVNLMSGAVSDIVQPRSQGFLQIWG